MSFQFCFMWLLVIGVFVSILQKILGQVPSVAVIYPPYVQQQQKQQQKQQQRRQLHKYQQQPTITTTTNNILLVVRNIFLTKEEHRLLFVGNTRNDHSNDVLRARLGYYCTDRKSYCCMIMCRGQQRQNVPYRTTKNKNNIKTLQSFVPNHTKHRQRQVSLLPEVVRGHYHCSKKPTRDTFLSNDSSNNINNGCIDDCIVVHTTKKRTSMIQIAPTEIQLTNVTVQYPKETWIRTLFSSIPRRPYALSNINLVLSSSSSSSSSSLVDKQRTIKIKQKTGVVVLLTGASSSGKSTLLKVIQSANNNNNNSNTTTTTSLLFSPSNVLVQQQPTYYGTVSIVTSTPTPTTMVNISNTTTATTTTTTTEQEEDYTTPPCLKFLSKPVYLESKLLSYDSNTNILSNRHHTIQQIIKNDLDIYLKKFMRHNNNMLQVVSTPNNDKKNQYVNWDENYIKQVLFYLADYVSKIIFQIPFLFSYDEYDTNREDSMDRSTSTSTTTTTTTSSSSSERTAMITKKTMNELTTSELYKFQLLRSCLESMITTTTTTTSTSTFLKNSRIINNGNNNNKNDDERTNQQQQQVINETTMIVPSYDNEDADNTTPTITFSGPIILFDEWFDTEPRTIIHTTQSTLHDIALHMTGICCIVTHKPERFMRYKNDKNNNHNPNEKNANKNSNNYNVDDNTNNNERLLRVITLCRGEILNDSVY